MRRLKGERLIVRAGEWDTCNDDELYPHVDVEVASVVQHEAINAATLYNDVALLTLDHPVDIMPHINTICLPDAEHSVDIHYEDCVATGWGKESFGESARSAGLVRVPGWARGPSVSRRGRLGRHGSPDGQGDLR